MKKVTVILFALLSFASSSFASITSIPYNKPWLWPFATTALFGNLATGTANGALGLYYWINAALSPSVSSTGDVTIPSKATWVDLTASPPSMVSQDLTTKMPFTTAQSIAGTMVSGSPKYPAAYNAFYGQTLNTPSLAMSAGMYFSGYGGATVKATSCTSDSGPNGTAPASGAYLTNGWVDFFGPSNSQSSGYAAYRYCAVTPATPPTGPLPAATAVLNLTGSSSGGNATSALQSQLDAMANDPNYVPSFSDATTGLPYAPPPSANVATPAAVTAYQTAQSADGSATSSTTATPGSSAGAGGASRSGTAPASSGSTSGGSAGTSVTGSSGSNGTAPVPASGSTPATVGNIGTAGTFTVPQLHTLSFKSANGLIGALQNAYPFNMLPTVANTLTQFVSTPSPPKYTLPLPLGINMTIDLTPWDGVATMCRYIIAAILTYGFIMSVVNFWRGVS
jgi:hypothetical protein